MNFFDWLTSWREMSQSKEERARACRACEVYRIELDKLHGSHERLLNEVVYLKNPRVEHEKLIPKEMQEVLNQPIPSPVRSWDATRARLEAADARQAEINAKEAALKRVKEMDEIARKNSILEKEVGVENA